MSSCINPRMLSAYHTAPALEDVPHLKHPASHWLADMEAVGEVREVCWIGRCVQDMDAAGEAWPNGDHEIVWLDL